nr:cytosine permease [Ornithinicoccus soli]
MNRCSDPLVGGFVGAAVLAPMGLFGPKTGANNAVSSGAHFGIAGRFIGSALALFSALLFGALTIWTSGDALAGGVARALGGEVSSAQRAVGYAVIFVIVLGVVLHGVHLVLRLQQRIMMPLVTVVLLIGLIAFGSKFDPGYAGGNYAFGSFWPTWIASALVVTSTILSYGPFIGDWTRYNNPDRHRGPSLIAATFLGGYVGMCVPVLFGAYFATSFASDDRDFVTALVAHAPLWYVPVLIAIGLVSGSGRESSGSTARTWTPRLSSRNSVAGNRLSRSRWSCSCWSTSAPSSGTRSRPSMRPWWCCWRPSSRGSWSWQSATSTGAAPTSPTTCRCSRAVSTVAGTGSRTDGTGAPWDRGVLGSTVGILFSSAPPFYTGLWSGVAGGVDISFLVGLVVGPGCWPRQ